LFLVVSADVIHGDSSIRDMHERRLFLSLRLELHAQWRCPRLGILSLVYPVAECTEAFTIRLALQDGAPVIVVGIERSIFAPGSRAFYLVRSLIAQFILERLFIAVSICFDI